MLRPHGLFRKQGIGESDWKQFRASLCNILKARVRSWHFSSLAMTYHRFVKKRG